MSFVSSATAMPYLNSHADMFNATEGLNVMPAQKGIDAPVRSITREPNAFANSVFARLGLASYTSRLIVQDNVPLLPLGKENNAFKVPQPTSIEHASFLISQTKVITSVTFIDTEVISATEVVCKANKYQIIPEQPAGTPEHVLRQHAKFPVTVGQVKGTIENGRTIIKDIEVNAEERGNGFGRALVERINAIGAQNGATCQVAENLFDIEAGNSVGPKKFWSSLGYTVKKQGDYLNAYRGDCSELRPRGRR